MSIPTTSIELHHHVLPPYQKWKKSLEPNFEKSSNKHIFYINPRDYLGIQKSFENSSSTIFLYLQYTFVQNSRKIPRGFRVKRLEMGRGAGRLTWAI